MALTPPTEQDPGDTKTILEWYDNSRPIFIDLVGDYAGKELFLVEGDSMLRECFADERIDFQGGFQLLHAVFVVERFLQNLLKRHSQFHIAFFDDHSELSVPSGVPVAHRPRYLLARSVVIRHLTTQPLKAYPNVRIHSFPSLGSDEFSAYLQATPIHFVMSHDGATIAGKASKTAEEDTLDKTWLRSIIWFFNSRKLNVALVNSIEFRDSKIFANIVRSSSISRVKTKEMALNFPEEVRTLKSSLEKSRSSGSETSITSTLGFDETTAAMKAVSYDSQLAGKHSLAVHAVSTVLKEENVDIFLPSAFALHVVLLNHLSLSQRSLPLVTFDTDFEDQVKSFLTSTSEIIWRTIAADKDSTLFQDPVDIIDGRLFHVVIQAMCDGSLDGQLPEDAIGEWTSLNKAVAKLTGVKLSPKGSVKPISSTATAAKSDLEEVSGETGVLPFSSPVFDKHLKSINVETDTSLNTRLSSMKISRDTQYWHGHRRPANPKYAPAPKVSKWRNPLRTNQFYMSEMTKYAASLTGAKGKALDPETITVGPKVLRKIVDETEKPEKSTAQAKKQALLDAKAKDKKGEAKKGTKNAAAGVSKKDQMKADNLARKGDTELDKALNAWSAIMKGLDSVTDDQERYLRTVDYLNGLDSAKTGHLEAEVNAYMLQSLLMWWGSYCKADKKTDGYHVVALIWATIRSICSSRNPVTKVILENVEKICSLLKISNAMTELPKNVTERKLSFAFKYPLRTTSLDIEMEQYAFQLDYCGPYMDRMLDAKPDARVSNFIPDGWQRKVLDQLDANKSVFVVAPTSAGKTFISFYAMEQVLRADNDGVLVFVAPTKALVNQIAAEVQARFSKRFPLPGKGVWAIHTRDYRVNNPTGCQILVTVPHILQTMLLSPTNAKSWAPRVRRIIFDEIHSIGSSDEGVVWEQLLLLAPCPIVALSATVGNPEQFNSWLAETQKAMGAEITMIEHKTRYSDLRKYFYEPPKTFSFAGLGKSYGVGLGLDGLTGFEAVHPASSLVDKSRGMPDDLALEPRDCLSLWKAMVKYETDDFKVPDSLHPSKALPACIRKIDIFAWEKDLKIVLQEWMSKDGSPFDKVLAALTPKDVSVSSDSSDSSAASSVAGDENSVDPNNLWETTLPLLFQLHKRRALPAILFNYDRLGCENVATAILHQLVAAESRWKEGPQWKKLIEGHEKYLEIKEKAAKKSNKPVKAVKKGTKGSDDEEGEGGSKTDRMRDESSEGSSFYDLFDPEAPQADFSFANHKYLQASELAIYVRQLRRKGLNEDLISLLQRGVGVHHSGMNRKYRQCIEMLFRKGFLRVIVATGTLSLGINMPCATVVFNGDSVNLTALNFRQAAGRSGRRGFDLLGNVVFQGIEKVRARRLLSSKLPDLTGHFPVTTTLVLRLFILLNDSKNSPYAVNAINSLLSQSRLYLDDKESQRDAVLHHLRFSIEYLRRNELLGSKGETVNFTSVISHLYFTENSSFAFHALLKGGYFHKLCADFDPDTDKAQADKITHEIMLTLSHLFGRRGCRDALPKDEVDSTKRPLSLVVLPVMPKPATQILRQHNKETLGIFTNYATTFAIQHIAEDEVKLPLTSTPVGRIVDDDSDSDDSDDEEDSFEFLHGHPAPKARSPFVALSGHGDKFKTIEDLCSSAREGVFLESAVIPHLDIHPDENPAPLNAYLLDFYIHGALEPLEKDNGVRKSEVWFELNDFSMILATICTSLAIYLGIASADSDAEMLDMGAGEAAEAEADEQEAAALELASASSVMSGTTNSKSTISSVSSVASGGKLFSKSKKKVADDWDADEDELTAEDKFRESEKANGSGTGSKSDDEEYEQLMSVYQAFKKLRTEFDEKFKAIFA